MRECTDDDDDDDDFSLFQVRLLDNYKDRSPGLHMWTLPLLVPTSKRRRMESILIQARTGGDDDMPGTMNEDNNCHLDSTWGRTLKFIRKEYTESPCRASMIPGMSVRAGKRKKGAL
mmetsp:Transcript_18732/g.32740  ORF Transcript_18732/g.32740 Transcript_18732/m.32740 type:complete len:117 (-) Transcript_18732:1655-2005(-)